MSPLIYLSFAWAAGVLAGTVLLDKIDDLPYLLTLAGLTPLPFLFFRRYRRVTLFLSLCLVAFFAAASYSFSSQAVTENDLSFYNDNGTREIRGIVARDPEVTDKNTRLYFSATELKLDAGWRPVEGKALLFVPRYADHKYGDELAVAGKLQTPPQRNDFDYKGYLAHQGIGSIMYHPRIEVVGRGEGFKPLEWVYDLRLSIADVLAKVLPEPQASLAQGIILGIRTNIPQDVKNDFTRSGTAHLLAISGLNLSIIAGIMLSIGIWLFGRRHYRYVWLAGGTVWLYALLTGMHPPVVRSAIMASLFLGAELFGRQKSALVSLTLAAAIMVGLSPYTLGDPSFQLSFLAMAGLVFLYPTLHTVGRNLVAKTLGEQGALVSLSNLASDSFSVTLAATIFVWPLIAYYFGIVSLVSPIANLFALPALPATIILGSLSGVVGLVFIPLAQVVGWVSWLFLTYILLVAHAFAFPPVSFLEVGKLNPALILTYYVALVTVLWFSQRRAPESHLTVPPALSRLSRKWVTLPLLVVAVLVWTIALAMPDDKVRVSFLDVGQGDAILIAQGRQQILIDGGPSPRAINLELSQKMPFWDREIDLVVSTHPHQDHLAGLVEVLKRYRVDEVMYLDFDYDSQVYREWRLTLDKRNSRVTYAQAGHRITLGEALLINVISPERLPDSGSSTDVDNNSLVMRVIAGDASFLLTSDIRHRTEDALLEQRTGVASTVYKIAHHGSKTSNSKAFLDAVNPRVAVISVGKNNEYGHPTPEVLARLEQKLGVRSIYRTDEKGTIEFITDGARLWVKAKR